MDWGYLDFMLEVRVGCFLLTTKGTKVLCVCDMA